MTYQKVKDVVVKERKELTDKQLRRLVIQVSLFVLGLAVCMAYATLKILGFPITLLVLVGCVLLYSWMFDYCAETPKGFKRIRIIAKFWVVFPVLFGVLFYVLTFLNF